MPEASLSQEKRKALSSQRSAFSENKKVHKRKLHRVLLKLSANG